MKPGIWAQVDALVKRHQQRELELVALAKEGGVYRKPRFIPPCVWRLVPRARVQLESSSHQSFETARAELLRHAEARREAKAARAAAKARRTKR